VIKYDTTDCGIQKFAIIYHAGRQTASSNVQKCPATVIYDTQ